MVHIEMKSIFKKYKSAFIIGTAIGILFGSAIISTAQNDLESVNPMMVLYALVPINAEFGEQSVGEDVTILNVVILLDGSIEIHMLINDKAGKLAALKSMGTSKTIYGVSTQSRPGSDMFTMTHQMPIHAAVMNRP